MLTHPEMIAAWSEIRTRPRNYLERVKKSAWPSSYEERQSGVRDAKKHQIPTFSAASILLDQNPRGEFCDLLAVGHHLVMRGEAIAERNPVPLSRRWNLTLEGIVAAVRKRCISCREWH